VDQSVSCVNAHSIYKKFSPAKARIRQSRLHKGQDPSKPNKANGLAFFDNRLVVYTNCLPRGTTVNINYIAGVLKNLLKDLH
jgi:hypothetical protein